MLLKNKIAVITGNPYGIGRVSAALLSTEGAQVICIDDGKTGWQSDRAQHDARPEILADVSNADALSEVVARCEETLEQIDILVNLAGRASKATFENTDEKTWDNMISRNLTAAFLCSRKFLPLIKKSQAGAIINHASIDGFLGNPSLAAYSAGKGGILSLTHVMAHDLGKYGIRVNSISTGGIRDGEERATDSSRIRVTPSKRTGTPLDVARVVLFLASELSSYVNGANIVVDGGRTVVTQGCYED